MNKDINSAIRALIYWFFFFCVGIIIADRYNLAAGLVIIAADGLTLAIALWFDYRIQKIEERLRNYIDHANDQTNEVLRNGKGKNV